MSLDNLIDQLLAEFDDAPNETVPPAAMVSKPIIVFPTPEREKKSSATYSSEKFVTPKVPLLKPEVPKRFKKVPRALKENYLVPDIPAFSSVLSELQKKESKSINSIGNFLTPNVSTTKSLLSKRVSKLSSMEKANLREKVHVSALKTCREIIFQKSRYSIITFRMVFSDEVS